MDTHHKDASNKIACLKLSWMRGLNNTLKIQLLEHYQHADRIFSAPLAEIKQQLPLAGHRITKAFTAIEDDRVEQQLALLEHHRIDIITYNSPQYPERLKQIADAPPILFVRGKAELLGGPQLAMVGSRNASPSGLKTAQAFATDLSRSGITITSGLASGIDAAAHRGALNEIGCTIAVVATGLDEVYPKQNISLAKDIVRHGLMISEFPPLTPARREHFPRRNRLISGLSLGTLVVEADTRSGSLITARLAGEQGREVFAIPGSIHLPTSRGCHQLIRQGAKLVETTADILSELKPALSREINASQPPAEHKSAAQDDFDAQTLSVLKMVDFAPTAIEDIVTHSNLSIDLVSSILLKLELTGHIAPIAGGQYQRIQA